MSPQSPKTLKTGVEISCVRMLGKKTNKVYELYQATRSNDYYLLITSDKEKTLYKLTDWNEEQKKQFGFKTTEYMLKDYYDEKNFYYVLSYKKQLFKLQIFENKRMFGIDPIVTEVYFKKSSEI